MRLPHIYQAFRALADMRREHRRVMHGEYLASYVALPGVSHSGVPARAYARNRDNARVGVANSGGLVPADEGIKREWRTVSTAVNVTSMYIS